MKRITPFVLLVCCCLSSSFDINAQTSKRQQQPQRKTGQQQKIPAGTGQPQTSQQPATKKTSQTNQEQESKVKQEEKKQIALPKINRPAWLGAGLLMLGYDNVGKMNKRMEKMGKDALAPYTDKWRDALLAAPVESVGYEQGILAFALFTPQVDALWENDQFQPAKLDPLIKRLKNLPRQLAYTWQNELQKIDSSWRETIGLETAGYLIQMDHLFSDDEFKEHESENMLVRLRSLSSSAIKDYKESLSGVETRQAAIMLIQIDFLFEQNQFQESKFYRILGKQSVRNQVKGVSNIHPVEGIYNMTIIVDSYAAKFLLALKLDGSKWTGEMREGVIRMTINSVKVDKDNKITIVATEEGRAIVTFVGIYSGSSITGDWSTETTKGSWKAYK